jgi:hypothetical protein
MSLYSAKPNFIFNLGDVKQHHHYLLMIVNKCLYVMLKIRVIYYLYVFGKKDFHKHIDHKFVTLDKMLISENQNNIRNLINNVVNSTISNRWCMSMCLFFFCMSNYVKDAICICVFFVVISTHVLYIRYFV